ncbi:unnamed protein product [Callosobruchus maculatus]|uniref:ABC transporter domain-containing protein n=1 Tax=Callosobruchus maculatus TaxID=64391 RepID=A0A653DDP7_CALMS|nr:unnamed protein product [Callosobruchus maculatus]
MWGGINLLLLLQWKYWILRIRSPLGMTCDFLFVIVIAVITLARNSTSGGTWHEKTIYQPFCASTKPIPYLCPNNTNFIDSSRPVKHPTRIIYSPENPHLAKIMNIFMVFGYEVEPKKNRKALEAYFRMNASTTLAGIQFDDSYSKATDLRNMKNFKASIRFPAEIGQSSISNWATHELIEREYGAGPPQGSSSYYKEEFLSLQQILGLAFIFSRDGSIDLDLAHLNESNSKIAKWVESKRFPQMYMQRFPYGEWWDDKGPRTAESLYSLKFLCALLPFVANTVKWIVLEKERQLKEFIKIMGLSTWMYWLSWFLQCYIYLLVLMTIFLILMLAPIVKQPIFPYSNSSIVLSFFLVYSAALVAFILATSALFPKATRAVICSIVFRIAAFALFNLVSTKGMAVQLAACLWPDTAICIGLEIIWKYEKQTEGCQRHNLFEPVTHERNTSLGLVILMLILDIFIYMFLAIYIEAIYPSEFGTHYPWNFLCKPSYWRPKRDTESNDIRDNKRVRSGFLEAEPKGLKAGVQIKGLTKVYGSTTAVDGLSLNLYENQITVLLGRNGAGKTTTISMLSGMITPTSGTAILNGYDIRRDMRFLRKCIGICPQHNILYDNLTVEEHLYFYSRIKALPKKEIKAEIKSYLVSMEFTNKRKKQAKSLSGGMKRKLCICIALCGNSKIVMLDEPTSGLDPNNRRKLWDLLLKHRTGKTILLTTHFMDEADVLGDRIAIMAGGELKCCGSSFFLKKLYGSGYILVIDKGPRCDVPKITALLKSSVPEVQLTPV